VAEALGEFISLVAVRICLLFLIAGGLYYYLLQSRERERETFIATWVQRARDRFSADCQALADARTRFTQMFYRGLPTAIGRGMCTAGYLKSRRWF